MSLSWMFGRKTKHSERKHILTIQGIPPGNASIYIWQTTNRRNLEIGQYTKVIAQAGKYFQEDHISSYTESTASSDTLSCYYCEGKYGICPEEATVSDLPNIETINCVGALASICTKYSVNYLNGDSYTVRNCAPESLDEYGETGILFCNFLVALYAPLIESNLIKSFSCSNCNSVDCNT